MKLLIITQKVDKNDPILGFFHRWIEEFAKNCEFITVICLGKGEYNLPDNVKVLSLGKEKKVSRLVYLWNFYQYLWQERKNYDRVFVHMNQEYVLLGGFFWKLFGKKISLWRNHAKGNLLTRLAVLLSDIVFCTSPQSFTAQFKKAKLMPVGIDTDFFCPDASISKKPRSILFLGRISPVKNVDIFVESLRELKKNNIDFSATIAGNIPAVDQTYGEMVKAKIADYGLEDQVRFIGPVNQSQARQLYREHELYVNLTPAGSLDKTIFEAMACGVVPLVYNQDLIGILSEEYLAEDLNSLNIAKDIKRVMLKEKRDFRVYVVENHSLGLLAKKLFEE